jgi:hypothetical protein
MRRTGDLAAILTILLGTFVGSRMYGSLLRGDRFDYVIERRFDDRRVERRFRVERGEGRGCVAPFLIDSRPVQFSVVGEYAGVARLTAAGLEIDFRQAAASAKYGDQDVREVVFGLTQEGDSGQWSIAHRSEPIPLGLLPDGATHAVPVSGVVIPDVTAADLMGGWLVVEHVLNAPDQPGGTAWTYAHAPRWALEPLLQDRCLS